MSEFKSQFAQGYEAGKIDEYHNNADELARLKAENNRLTSELEQRYESYNLLLSRFRHLLQSDFIRSFDEYDRLKGDYKRDIKEADMIEEYHNNADELARLKAENNRLTFELEHVYELYYTLMANKKAPGVLFICDKQKDCNKSPTCSWGLSGCTHTFDVSHARNFKQDISGNYVEASGVCPFGDCKETCSDYRINRCDLCKFEDKGAEK